MKFMMAGSTHRGRVRPYNQDSVFYSEHLGIGMVADGIGGNKGGEIASSMAISGVRKEVMKVGKLNEQEVIPFLNETINKVNIQILARGVGQADISKMGTTFECILISDDHIFITHVGDSRSYLFSNGRLSQITQDHNIENCVEKGWIKASELHRGHDPKALTCALGFSYESKIDFFQKKAEVGEMFLLASDGLTDMVSPKRIERILADPKHDFSDLPEVLIAQANRAGGRDNITVVIATVVQS